MIRLLSLSGSGAIATLSNRASSRRRRGTGRSVSSNQQFTPFDFPWQEFVVDWQDFYVTPLERGFTGTAPAKYSRGRAAHSKHMKAVITFANRRWS
jgi:hypothetical protein